MPGATPEQPRHRAGDFAEARTKAIRAEATQRDRAVRTVAHNAIDVQDCRALLAMLGLETRARNTDTADTDGIVSATTQTQWRSL